MADVGFDRLLREEEALTDLSIHQSVCDKLKNLDLARGGILADLTRGSGRERDDRAVPVRAAPCRSRLEAATVVAVAVEDLLTLSGVHATGIGDAAEPL